MTTQHTPETDAVTDEDLDALFEKLAQHTEPTPEDLKEAAAPTKAEEEEIPLDAILRTYYAKKAIIDKMAADLAAERPVVLKRLLQERRRTKSKSWDVTVEDTEGNEYKVGTTTLPKTEPKNIATDPDALKEWLKANDHKDLVLTREIPPVEARTEEIPDPKAVDILIKEKHLKVSNGEIIDPKTGEAVPFARHEKAAEPTSFTAGMGGSGKPGQAKILELLEESNFEGMELTDLLATPAITAKK